MRTANEGQAEAPPAAPSRPRVKILLVDDNRDNLFSLQAALEPLGEEILSASSGKQALRLCLDNDFAAILLDVRMPDMDGFETAEFIRSRKRSKHTPLLFVTGYRSDEQLFRGYDLGAVDFLFRPLVPEILQSKVRVFVELSRTAGLLRESERSLRQLAESLPQLVWTCAPDGRCDYLGPQWVGYTGLPEGSQLGFGWLDQLHPEDRFRTIEAWNDAVRSGGNLDVEFRIRRQDGMYRWFKTRAVPLKDEQGRIVKWFGTNTDIEESKAAAEQVRQSMEELAAVMEVAPIPIWVAHDRECRHITGNRAANTLFEAREGENLSAASSSLRRFFLDGRECEASELPMECSVRDNREIRDAECEVLLPSGTRRMLWGYASPLRHPDGTARASVGAFVDITETKAIEKALRQSEESLGTLNAELENRICDRTAQLEASNKELEAFAYSVAHDLRAPLRVLDGFSSILLSEHYERLDADARHCLDRIQAASQLMGRLITDLLNLSRLSRRELTRQKVDLSRLARDVAAALRAEDPGRGAEFRIADDLVVEGDHTLLAIVVQNLLGNAWKFTKNTPLALIEVGRFEQGNEQVYFVRDNGVGFDMAYAGQLFTAFQRLHSAHQFPGTGIGLATVKRILARHGGRVWPEAKVDGGATFYFTIGR